MNGSQDIPRLQDSLGWDIFGPKGHNFEQTWSGPLVDT